MLQKDRRIHKDSVRGYTDIVFEETLGKCWLLNVIKVYFNF